ncbi:alpha/beta fold hydrolase [Allosphingosinicella indica]|uniref:Pimeloyl-ACP methyl ester carboxylesterase n=1 Tax=Allosphingosinicella indica TaxID=941907 RepID=A0A1X7G3J1_9SPHN|nr:alpha/beta hydrolase [Allosphingosinicella indica]SMF63405.1 Pimeloyl-ACP methyl ester carboxylesterase [Allosphingosinicella indica]
MDRRSFTLSALALGVLGAAPVLAQAASWRPTRFSVRVRGSGPDVLLIPGLTAGRSVWSDAVTAVPGYRYHLLQVAGFAGEPAGGNANSAVIQPLVAEIARYIADQRLVRPAIVGHSMGGTVAMMLAARHPARVGKLMVVDMLPAPAGLVGSDAAAIRPLADSLRSIFTSSPGGRRLMEGLMGNFGGGAAATGSDPDVVAQAMHELALIDLKPELPRIAAPMEVVYATPPAGGGVDPAVIVRDYRSAYAGAKGARLTRIANSGHMVMLDQPAAFAAALKSFLAR